MADVEGKCTGSPPSRSSLWGGGGECLLMGSGSPLGDEHVPQADTRDGCRTQEMGYTPLNHIPLNGQHDKPHVM